MKLEKLTLPKAKFSHELHAAPVEATMKAAEATTAKLYRVPIDKIKTIPGFNVRVPSPDYIAHRDTLRASIAANGYDSTKPIAGYVAKEGDESVIYVTDGHTRLDAVREFNADPDTAEAAEITSLPVMVHPKEVSLTDLTVALHTANSGRPLTPFELGIIVKRLLASDEGATKPEIAKRLAVSTRYLDDVLLLANADSKVKQHVAAGAVSSTLAIDLLRKDPDNAAGKIEAAVSKATPGKKVTKKHVGTKMQKVKSTVSISTGADMKEIVKAVAAAVRNAVEVSEGDNDVKLAAVDGTITLVVEVPVAVEKPAKAPKAPKAEAETEVKPKPKVVKDAKAKKPAKEPKAPPPVEGAEEMDDEVAILPPKVASDADVEEVDI